MNQDILIHIVNISFSDFCVNGWFFLSKEVHKLFMSVVNKANKENILTQIDKYDIPPFIFDASISISFNEWRYFNKRERDDKYKLFLINYSPKILCMYSILPFVKKQSNTVIDRLRKVDKFKHIKF